MANMLSNSYAWIWLVFHIFEKRKIQIYVLASWSFISYDAGNVPLFLFAY